MYMLKIYIKRNIKFTKSGKIICCHETGFSIIMHGQFSNFNILKLFDRRGMERSRALGGGRGGGFDSRLWGGGEERKKGRACSLGL